MAKLYDTLTPKLVDFIEAQQMFFVASAPMSGDGHINLSPKGMDCLRILDDHTLAYLDLTGSGVETISHVRENGRLVFMFCAFEGSPLIVRLHGRGEVYEPHEARFAELRPRFPDLPGVRSIIQLTAERISDSCGWTVPLYQQTGTRDHYDNYAAAKGPEGIEQAKAKSNMQSIDGLTGLTRTAL